MILQFALLAGLAAPTQGDVVQILLDGTHKDPAAEIARLSPFPVEEVFWMLQGDEIPAAWNDASDEDQFLSSTQERILERALRDAPREVCLEYLRELAGTELGIETKATIVEILGWIGTHNNLDVLLLAASPESERYLAPARLRRAFGDALADVFSRHADRMEPELPWLFRNAHSGLRLEVVHLVENEALLEPIEVLARMLDVHSEFDVLVLQTMHMVALRPTEDGSQVTKRAVRAFLRDDDAACVRLACRTLGALEDVESITDLIHLLDSDDSNQRAAAAYGLSVGTGLQFGENVVRWRSWFERERVWWEERSIERFDELAHGEIGIAMRALREISEHCLDRDELARGVAPALERPERGLVLTAIAFLARLESRAAVPDLIPLLDRRDEDVRRAAWRTLVRLSGQRLAPEVEAWEAYRRSLTR